jgi:penicillin amidase
MILDDAAAVVPESEMAKDAAVYAKLKARVPTPGWWFRGLPDDMLRFSHAWAVDGARSATGKPLLEGDPQTSVNNPPLWYEFHLSAGRFDVRGISVAGSPGMLIGFNRNLAWGASALGASSTVTFLDKAAGGHHTRNAAP